MNKKTDEIALKEYIKCAYKKLKSNSYYDNKNIFLKNRIVEFENNGKKIKSSTRYVKDIENKFEKLEKTILNKEKINFKFKHSSKLTDNYLKRQGCFTIRSVPKSIADDEYGNNIIRNFEKKDSNAEVDKLMYYIDIDIMSQIIGTLWVMIIGKDLENLYKDYTAGNLLEEDIDNNNLKLFKPYYLSYERWRDDAINIVDDRINNGNRSTMLSLDIKEYYYSINLDIKNDKEKIIDIFKNSKNKKYISLEIFKYINDYVFKVIEEYSNIMNLKELSDNTSKKIRNILPIGFLPSSILSNWYLKEFDEAVNSKINALYYKRYVDDILIVLNTDYKKQEVFEEESLLNTKFYDTELFEIGVLIDTKNKKETDKLTEVIILDSIKNLIKFVKKIDRIDIKLKQNILFVIENSLNKEIFNEEDIFLDWEIENPIERKINLEELEKNLRDINKNLIIKSNKFKKIYLIKDYIKNKPELNGCSAYLIIQDEKVKLYDFLSTGSKALIENFKNEIAKNSSVFKFLPQKDEVLNSFDREVYKVDYKDSINKLSSIKDFKINRYNLSKFLARIIYSDKLENDDYTKDVDEKILWIFKGKYAVEYFFLWDKVLNYYLMNRRYDFIKDLFVNIYSSIEKLELNLSNFTLNDVNWHNYQKENLKTDLKYYLKFVLARNYALNDSIFINDIKLYNNCDEYDKYIKNALKNRLSYENRLELDIDGLYRLKEEIRISNMMNHSFVKSPLMNYYYLKYRECYLKQFKLININFVNYIVGKPEILTDKSRCFLINANYKNCIFNNRIDNSKKCKHNNCNIEMCEFAVEYNLRFVHLHECILNSIHNIIAKGEVISKGREIIEAQQVFYKLNNLNYKKNKNFNNIYSDINNILKCKINLEQSCENKNYKCKYKYNTDECKENKYLKEMFLDTHFKYFDFDDYLFVGKERVINYLEYAKEKNKNKLKIGIVNMKIHDNDLESSFKKIPNISSKRLEKISALLNTSVKNGAELIVFPEVSIPIEWLGVVADFARRHEVLIVCGLEHIIYDNKLCCNYIATILPDKYKDYTFAAIKLRLKNHYSPKEKEWVKGYGWELPKENENWKKEYDLFRWKGIDFSTFSCFELANIKDRALFTSFVDLLIGSVHNRDINYYSNVMESLSRDVHCYFVHVNDSVLGDNRIIQPSSTNNKNILQISGGINNVVLVGEIDIKKLREFQIKDYNLQINDKSFKPVPPEYKHKNVKIRSNLPL